MNASPLAACLLAAVATATCAVSTATRAADANPPAPASAKAPAKPASKAPAKAPAKTPAKAPDQPPSPAEVPLTQAQLDLSGLVLLGDLGCEMQQHVSLWPLPLRPGHFELRFGRSVYTLVPHETTTGAVRLEDATAGVVWLQIPVKSMLLDARRGQRLVDGCMHTAQRHAQADAASAPPGGPGLGITDLQR